MKNLFDNKNPAKNPLKRTVKKWDIHSCSMCFAVERRGRIEYVCTMKNNKQLDYLAIQKHVIPEWCKLSDY